MNNAENRPFAYPVETLARNLLNNIPDPGWRMHGKDWSRVLSVLKPVHHSPEMTVTLISTGETGFIGIFVMAELVAREHRLIRRWHDVDKRYALYVLSQEEISTIETAAAAAELGMYKGRYEYPSLLNPPQPWQGLMRDRTIKTVLETAQTQLLERAQNSHSER